VPLAQIVPGKNARPAWERVDARLLDLAASIREHGILEPLLVRELPARSGSAGRVFELLAGFRRLAAARHLGLARVPARVVLAGDDEALALNLAENLAREDLAEADALRVAAQLQETYGWGVRRIARATGRSASWISDLLQVAGSAEERRALEAGQVAFSTAVRIARLKRTAPALREALLRRAAAGERLELEDVPRVRRMDQAGAITAPDPEPAETRASARPSESPRSTATAHGGTLVAAGIGVSPPAAAVAPASASVPALALSRHEQSLVYNARLMVRQVLASLRSVWEEQGRERRLPGAIRDELRRTGEEIDAFLALEPGG
jgi:ParB family chromosome partitioning protein